MTTTTISLTFGDLLLAVRHRQTADQMSGLSDICIKQKSRKPADDLVPRLRQLCLLAEQSGAGAEWITKTADAVVAALLNSQQLERDNLDPRRQRSKARAAQMASTVRSMREAGHGRGACVTALRERHGLSRSRVYELLALCPGT